MQVIPGERRSRVEHVGTTTRIIIPARRYFTGTLFMLAWLGGWSAGGYAAFQPLVDNLNKGRTK